MTILINNIRELFQIFEGSSAVCGKAMADSPSLKNAYLFIRDGLIDRFGPAEDAPEHADVVLDAKERLVLPVFIDSHTHIVFPAYREEEFVMKIRGVSYQDIARSGGGILNSARKLNQCSEDELFHLASGRVQEVVEHGTGALEIKSGYGLSVESELKMLRVARRLGEACDIPVRTTFLGAHAVPAGITKDDYVRMVIGEMIPAVAAEHLADYIDVFCEEGFFSMDQSIEILEAGVRAGMKARVHANQLSNSGGVQAAVKTKALSADHLEQIGEEEIKILASSQVMPTALPGAANFLGLSMPPARKMIEAGLPISIASDYNPGSSPSGNLMLMWSLACIRMKMTPEEGLHALTINPAISLEWQSSLGSIWPGKRASLIITRPSERLAFLPYHYGMNAVDMVMLDGQIRFNRNANKR
ncbi:MAG: imidazolonepropionase [Bacteroidetes bacterium]|nr:imidazolonepropionase [Bacteroidota bacterium]